MTKNSFLSSPDRKMGKHTVLEVFWGHFYTVLEMFWGLFGPWVCFRNVLGMLLVMIWACFGNVI